MDSFYDAPRSAPIPRPMEKVTLAPVVPDVSLIWQNTPSNDRESYNSWINQVNKINPAWNKENTLGDTQQFLVSKKHVHFESIGPGINVKTPGCSNEIVRENKNTQEDFPRLFGGKSLQEIYMANIPTRHLDLSVIDVNNEQESYDIAKVESATAEVKPATKISDEASNTSVHVQKAVLPNTYREFLESQQSQKCATSKPHHFVTDLLNYSRNHSTGKTSRKNVRVFSPKPLLPQNTCSKDIGKNYKSLNRSDWEKRKEYVGPLKSVCFQGNTAENCNLNHNKKAVEEIGVNTDSSWDAFKYKAFDKENIPEKEVSTGGSNVENYPKEISNKEYLSPKNVIAADCNNFKNIKADCNTQTSTIFPSTTEVPSKECEKVKPDEPTVRDLLKIIQQQNEQLILLQKQVSTLLEHKESHKQIEAPPTVTNKNILTDRYLTSTQYDNLNMQRFQPLTPRKGPSKFSIDLMTSFEVSFRPQQNAIPRKNREYFPEAKIQEISETDPSQSKCIDDKATMASLQLQEPINVKEACPSPEPSIRIDMNDYDSSDEDDTSSSSGSETGLTLYKNVMKQVNNIIKHADLQGTTDKEKTIDKVKEATIKQLRRIGVNLPPMENISEDIESSDRDCNNSNEINFVVKQLLMKYLPDEQLAKITCKKSKRKANQKQEQTPLNLKRAPEFSIASLEYMKKYNLIDEKDELLKKALVPPVIQNLKNQNPGAPKILDISALKQQPKLL